MNKRGFITEKLQIKSCIKRLSTENSWQTFGDVKISKEEKSRPDSSLDTDLKGVDNIKFGQEEDGRDEDEGSLDLISLDKESDQQDSVTDKKNKLIIDIDDVDNDSDSGFQKMPNIEEDENPMNDKLTIIDENSDEQASVSVMSYKKIIRPYSAVTLIAVAGHDSEGMEYDLFKDFSMSYINELMNVDFWLFRS